jgi:hypothetical protein
MKMNIILYAGRLLAVSLILLACTIVLNSCDEDEVDSTVVLHSFGPAGVEHGDKIKFIGLNLDRVTSIVLPGIEVAASSFVSTSNRTLEIVVPMEAEAGKNARRRHRHEDPT